MNAVSPPEPLPVAVRALASPPTKNSKKGRKDRTPGSLSIGFSDWTLIFDTETTTDASQRLRFGVYQVRKSGRLRKTGFFYEPLSLTESELAALRSYADDHALEVLTVQQFVDEVFFPYAYERGGLCVGLNLPFDLSRIAVAHGLARGRMGCARRRRPARWGCGRL